MSTAASPEPLSYAAAVLCGGHSTRMGRDKAHLPAPGSSQPLLLRQLALLSHLQPAPATRFVSARSGQDLPALPADVTRINDAGTHGPLGGLVALLEALTTDHLLVIPVDTPHLAASDLTAFLSPCDANSARVATTPDGLHPLVALYPRTFAHPFRAALSAGHLGIRRRLSEADLHPFLQPITFPNQAVLTNWNRPDDIS